MLCWVFPVALKLCHAAEAGEGDISSLVRQWHSYSYLASVVSTFQWWLGLHLLHLSEACRADVGNVLDLVPDCDIASWSSQLAERTLLPAFWLILAPTGNWAGEGTCSSLCVSKWAKTQGTVGGRLHEVSGCLMQSACLAVNFISWLLVFLNVTITHPVYL